MEETDGLGEEIERPIKVEFIDIPLVYAYSDPNFEPFFNNLSNSGQLEVFQTKPI